LTTISFTTNGRLGHTCGAQSSLPAKAIPRATASKSGRQMRRPDFEPVSHSHSGHNDQHGAASIPNPRVLTLFVLCDPLGRLAEEQGDEAHEQQPCQNECDHPITLSAHGCSIGRRATRNEVPQKSDSKEDRSK